MNILEKSIPGLAPAVEFNIVQNFEQFVQGCNLVTIRTNCTT